MAPFLANTAVSLLVGLLLWAFLPRGVVLTRELSRLAPDGSPQFQTWAIRNDSSLPVRITRVVYEGVNTFNGETGVIESRELVADDSIDQEERLGVGLRFDDSSDEMARQVHGGLWSGQVVRPGDTLTAYVNLNRSMTIRYRREGSLGFLERRVLTIQGGI
jgi:hypothetical protein